MTEVSDQAWATVGFLLSQLGSANARWFHETLVPVGLEPRQFAILRWVAQDEGRSQQALGDALGIAPSRMVALIDELEERGLVERRTNPADRRARALHVTADGRRLLATAMERALAHEAQLCAPLTLDERQALVELLQRVAAGQGLIPGVHPELRTGDSPLEHDH
ncbi:MAG TPA: MarR family winged helix-turn-helix transcriptional regulator [Acidimicrobiales bacterium]|nr:MarR family winged helix-turn-helix transcriptional regulator [Acidimicrobiales bacterium]